jgi:hypothetical protein
MAALLRHAIQAVEICQHHYTRRRDLRNTQVSGEISYHLEAAISHLRDCLKLDRP